MLHIYAVAGTGEATENVAYANVGGGENSQPVWWHSNSSFCKIVSGYLPEGSFRWHHHKWGLCENKESARVKGGRDLYHEIRRQDAADAAGKSHYILFGYSHGGNVMLEALTLLALDEGLGESEPAAPAPDALKPLSERITPIFIGTPFIHHKAEGLNYHVRAVTDLLLRFIKYLFFFCLGLFALSFIEYAKVSADVQHDIRQTLFSPAPGGMVFSLWHLFTLLRTARIGGLSEALTSSLVSVTWLLCLVLPVGISARQILMRTHQATARDKVIAEFKNASFLDEPEEVPEKPGLAQNALITPQAGPTRTAVEDSAGSIGQRVKKNNNAAKRMFARSLIIFAHDDEAIGLLRDAGDMNMKEKDVLPFLTAPVMPLTDARSLRTVSLLVCAVLSAVAALVVNALVVHWPGLVTLGFVVACCVLGAGLGMWMATPLSWSINAMISLIARQVLVGDDVYERPIHSMTENLVEDSDLCWRPLPQSDSLKAYAVDKASQVWQAVSKLVVALFLAGNKEALARVQKMSGLSWPALVHTNYFIFPLTAHFIAYAGLVLSKQMSRSAFAVAGAKSVELKQTLRVVADSKDQLAESLRQDFRQWLAMPADSTTPEADALFNEGLREHFSRVFRAIRPMAVDAASSSAGNAAIFPTP